MLEPAVLGVQPREFRIDRLAGLVGFVHHLAKVGLPGFQRRQRPFVSGNSLPSLIDAFGAFQQRRVPVGCSLQKTVALALFGCSAADGLRGLFRGLQLLACVFKFHAQPVALVRIGHRLQFGAQPGKIVQHRIEFAQPRLGLLELASQVLNVAYCAIQRAVLLRLAAVRNLP